jgi:Trk K+ transport system NAD-binding subunit
MARRTRRLDAVAILGLGRFGTSLALELMKEEVEW